MRDEEVSALIAQAVADLKDEIAPAIAEGLRVHSNRPAGERGAPTVQFGVIVDTFPDQGYALVVLDGQTQATACMTLNAVLLGERVAVLFYPPSGTLILGQVAPSGGGVSLPPGGATGYRLTKNSPADFDVGWAPDQNIPAAQVTSVAGRTGAVQINLADVVGFHYASYLVTLDGSNNGTAFHGAPFVPFAAWLMPTGPFSGPNQGFPVITALTTNTVTFRYQNTAGSLANTQVSGYVFVVH